MGRMLKASVIGTTELLLNRPLCCINKRKSEEREIMKENLCIFTGDNPTDREKKKH